LAGLQKALNHDACLHAVVGDCSHNAPGIRAVIWWGVTRVARIITRLNIGGPSIQAIGLTRDLTEAGYETCLIHGHLGEGEGDMTRLRPISADRAVYIEALVRPVSPFKDVRAFWRIYKTLLQWKPDIVHTHQAKAGTLGRLAALAYNSTPKRVGKARLIHTYHGHVFEGYFRPAVTRVFLMIERWLARHTDVLIAVSPEIGNDLLSTYGIAHSQQVRIVPLGFNLDGLLALSHTDRVAARQRLSIAEDAIVVTTVGRLTAIKHHAAFIDMAARLQQKSSRFVFLIAGDGELRSDLERQASDRRVDRSLRFMGWQGDLEQLYAATDIFVLTSRNEGTPVALIEAMAAGLATVSTDVGGVRDVITSPNLGTVVRAGDTSALVEAVAEFAEDPARCRKAGLEARTSVRERFHVRRLLDDIAHLYHEVLSHSRSS